MVVYSFVCGHVGRTNESPLAKTQAFIRVAEIRDANVTENHFPCPECKGKDNAV